MKSGEVYFCQTKRHEKDLFIFYGPRRSDMFVLVYRAACLRVPRAHHLRVHRHGSRMSCEHFRLFSHVGYIVSNRRALEGAHKSLAL
jgi:hypothetical protein